MTTLWIMMGTTVILMTTMALSALIVVRMTAALSESVATAFQKALSPGELHQPMTAQVEMTQTIPEVEEELPWEKWEPRVLNPNTEDPTAP